MDDDMFGPPSTRDVSVDDKISELERELRARARVYPRMIERGSLTEKRAAAQVLILRSILEDYQNKKRRPDE